MQQKRFVIPRFHNVALVVLNYGPLAITARQLTLLLLAVILGYNLFRLEVLPLLLRILLIVVVVVVVLPFGFVSVAGRPLDTWLLVVLRYWMQPRVCIWRPRSANTKQQGI